jgi:hypothetical protein
VTPEGSFTCEQLNEGLTFLGNSDQTFEQVTCIAQPDGCRCTFDVAYTKAVAAFYNLDMATVGQVSFTNIAGTNASVDSTYCVDAAGLRFGEGFERFSSVGAGLTYTKADCHDGEQGPVETGPDCGPVCDRVCP